MNNRKYIAIILGVIAILTIMYVIGYYNEKFELKIHNEIFNVSKVEQTSSGEYVLSRIYEPDEFKKAISSYTSKDVLEDIETWEYSDNTQDKSPYHTLQGKSNCQGITLYLYEVLKHLDKDNILKLKIEETDLENEVKHLYLNVYQKSEIKRLDFVREYELSYDRLVSILENLGGNTNE